MKVIIDGYSANMRFSSSHMMPGIGKCGRLHGHTYYVHVEIEGEPDDEGIIIDFISLKNYIREILGKLDHRVLIPEKNGQIKIQRIDDTLEVEMGEKKYTLPSDDCVLLPLGTTSAENLSMYILSLIANKIKEHEHKNLRKINVRVDEGPGQGAESSLTLGGE